MRNTSTIFKDLLLLFVTSLSCFLESCNDKNDIFIEAESFDRKGGWVMDTQSINQMGSPYLMAHGLGETVENAKTTFNAKKPGKYQLWVRTRDWVKTWNKEGSPGRFQLILNGKKVKTIFGTEKAEWHWQNGGVVDLNSGSNSLELNDLTGFNGRCDAVYFTDDLTMTPPNSYDQLLAFRNERTCVGTPQTIENYDLVVVGGGVAGCCAAVSAARLGCKVALIQNRPVLGGNNSSEVRVGLSGLILQEPYPNLGNLMDELGGIGVWTVREAKLHPKMERSKQILNIVHEHPEKRVHNAGPAENYEDDKKLNLIKQHKNIDLYLNTHVFDVEKKGSKIVAVIGKHTETGKEIRFVGNLFVDCTGDGDVGYLAGADFRMGRESKKETSEPSAPECADSLVMGTSVQWNSEKSASITSFPKCEWAVEFTDSTCCPLLRGDWKWETGLNKNQITQIEEIRDYALRAVFGNWSYLKNSDEYREKYANKKLSWVAYIGGKRESRRLLGDVILDEVSILNQKKYDDASFTSTWDIDLHYPKEIKGLKEESFMSYCVKNKIEPFAVPYRCLYSRNISNLFMAGRNISVTHVALGTIRVMRTAGMMGEVVGMAASICKEKNTSPRGVYEKYLQKLKHLMEQGVGVLGFPEGNRVK